MTEHQTAFEVDVAPRKLREGRGDDAVQTLAANRASAFEDATARRPCTNGDCPYAADPRHPLEQAWIELMSPVPKERNSISPAPSPGVAQPNPLVFEEIREALRPRGITGYSIETIRRGWQEVLEEHLSEMPERLGTGLARLSRDWEGDDFDAFAEQVEVARSNFIEALEEIDAARAELEYLEERIYACQGGDSGEVPFPAPDVWRAGSSMINDSKIHVRPAWASGDCAKDRGEGESWENLGLPEDFTESIVLLVEQRAGRYAASGMDPEQARRQAMADYDQSVFSFGEHFSETMKRASDEYNAGIEGLHQDLTQAQTEPSLEHTPRTPPTITDTDFTIRDPELDPPPTPRPPPPADFGSDYLPAPADPPDLGDPGSNLGGPPTVPTGAGTDFSGPGGPGGFASPGVVGSGPDWDGRWRLGGDDAVSGGLASGGAPGGLPGGGGGGVGAPSGVGAAGGAGGAAVPGAVGGASRGGAASAAARGTAGRGAARGGPGVMGGGGRGGAGPGEDEARRETWLTEDEDVWGIGNEDDDPYA